MTKKTEHLDLKSHDISAEKTAEILRLFPEIRTEGGKLDFDRLKLTLGEAVDTGRERYGMTWPGKADCFKVVQTPSTGTLLPASDESVNFDIAQNIIIEGDNLEVLKLLQKAYLGNVKMIYIDPPYNTGKDFIYPDNYTQSLRTYLEYTGQIDSEGRKFDTNNDREGRFHSRWMNLMYPRLYLASNLLSADGSIFISIDEKEINNLRTICNDVFGEECFVAVITVLCNPKGRSQDKYFATNHEYILVYSKSPLPKGAFSVEKEEAQIEVEYPEEDELGKYRLMELRNTHREFGRHNRPNLYYPFYVSKDGEVSLDAEEEFEKVLPIWDDGFKGCWTWERSKAIRDFDLLVAQQIDEKWKIYRKSYANGTDRMLKTILHDKMFYTERGQKEFNSLFNTKEKLFQSPKSPHLLAQLLQTSTSGSDLILDFFAGSGSTAHAILLQNALDNGKRRYILVQLPESLDPEDVNQKAAIEFCDKFGKPRNIVELTKERVRRALVKIIGSEPSNWGDNGFRVFKLAESNFKEWDASAPKDATGLITQLELHRNHLREGRTSEDILYEILLKSGYPLTTRIETIYVGDQTVYSIADGNLMVCLDRGLTLETIRAMAARKPKRVVCLDTSFESNDQLKANAAQIFKAKEVIFKTI